MRRPALAVDTSAPTNLQYDLDVSPRSSLYSDEVDKKSPISPVSVAPVQVVPEPPANSPTPSVRLLFSLLSRRQCLLLLLPAIVCSMIAGGIAPFMTLVIGQAFTAYAGFHAISSPSQSDKDNLLHGIGVAALELVGLAVGSVALGSITSCLWIWAGENNVMALRKRVYGAVTQKNMVWFDTKTAAEGTAQSAEDSQAPMGAGGLMAKFTRFVRFLSSIIITGLIMFFPGKLTTFDQLPLLHQGCLYSTSRLPLQPSLLPLYIHGP